jgi:hypothetical protein
MEKEKKKEKKEKLCACHTSYGKKHKIERSWSTLAWAKGETLSQK